MLNDFASCVFVFTVENLKMLNVTRLLGIEINKILGPLTAIQFVVPME